MGSTSRLQGISEANLLGQVKAVTFQTTRCDRGRSNKSQLYTCIELTCSLLQRLSSSGLGLAL
jgi:hypothetical protein